MLVSKNTALVKGRNITSDSPLWTGLNPPWKRYHRIKKDIQTDRIDHIAFNQEVIAVTTHGKKGCVRLFNRRTGLCFAKYKNDTIVKPYNFLSPEKNYMLKECPDDIRYEIWDLNTERCTQRLEFPRRLQCLAFLNERLLTISQVNLFQEWDMGTGECLQEHRLDVHTSPVTSLAVSPDERYFCTSSVDAREVFQWDAKTYSLLETYDGATKSVYLLTVAPDSRHIVVRGIENRVNFIHTETGSVEKTFDCQDDFSNSMVFLDDGTTLVTFHKAGKGIRIWDIKRGTFSKLSSKHLKDPEFIRISKRKTMIVRDKAPSDRLKFIDLGSNTLLGTLININHQKRFLWETPPDETDEHGLFWSDKPEEVMEVIKSDAQDSEKPEVLKSTDPKSELHISDHNQSCVMSKIENNKDEYEQNRLLYTRTKEKMLKGLQADLWSTCLPEPHDVSGD